MCCILLTASSDGPTSPPSQRRRGQDSSAADLMPMPTSPTTDMLSPAAPQDTSLFSSPQPSGPENCRCILGYFSFIQWIKMHFDVVCLFFSFWTVLPNEVDMSSPLMYGTPSSRVEGTPRSGVRGTPARQRPDLGSVRKAPQVDLHSEPVSRLYYMIIIYRFMNHQL